ncbi:hypothetical protein QTG54_001640 [Skeletonema marinoi]|uniref:Secreted protein n=1 Tax=Skeletonema marinoi TaxID=267567 RepID=A0AAD8YK95_9STRA|nr:hypothetical protein QTG54_001640 [Skeletonema marinoi]
MSSRLLLTPILAHALFKTKICAHLFTLLVIDTATSLKTVRIAMEENPVMMQYEHFSPNHWMQLFWKMKMK